MSGSVLLYVPLFRREVRVTITVPLKDVTRLVWKDHGGDSWVATRITLYDVVGDRYVSGSYARSSVNSPSSG